VLTALVAACASRPRRFTVPRDPEAEREVARLQRFYREFPDARPKEY
jgi:hypothetical protein